MNNKTKIIIKNLYYTVGANFTILAISMFLNLFVPKLLGVREYSYWQLYVFYSSYVGFLHLGWIDGIYLKIGGEEYSELDKKNLGSQFWYLVFFETVLSVGIISWAYFFMSESNQSLILILTAVVSVITIAKTYILYIFQSTNRIKEYAQLSRSDRYLYILFLVIYFALGGRNFWVLILIDSFSKFIMLLWGMNRIRDMLKVNIINLKYLFKEILDNISIGSKLMLSNVASMLIIGTIRFFIGKKWDIVTFGKLSFTLSISNMFLTFINAVGVVMFPLLRRTNKAKLPMLFLTLRGLFVPFTYSFLIMYVPAKFILSIWLPEYATSLYYMGILFPMVIYEGRMALLINTYLKTLRKEKTILLVNVLSLLASLLVSLFAIFIIGNLILAVTSILFVLMFRCILAELLLCKVMNVKIDRAVLEELLITFIFISSNILLNNSWQSMFIYSVAYLIYLFVNHSSILREYKTILNLIKK